MLESLATDSVPTTLYRRHLGLPACAELDERLESLANGARQWFTECSEPFIASREVDIQRIVYDVIHLRTREQLSSALLARGFARAGVDQLIVVGITAGHAVDQQIDELWRADRPDKAMFLNAYAIASVEHWRWQVGDHLSRHFTNRNREVLPHYSPGYDGWGLADQARLYRLLCENREPGHHDEMPIQLMESGALLPHKSTLAVYGVTPHENLGGNVGNYWSCRALSTPAAAQSVSYAFPEKTLKKWTRQRLTLKATNQRTLHAKFRLDGTTCTNLGVPLAFDYSVELERDAAGRQRIRATDCRPATEHRGYKSMCGYLDNPERFMSQLGSHRPLVGHYLDEALTWSGAISPAGCLCSRASQDHKWRIVFQTIHFALEDHE